MTRLGAGVENGIMPGVTEVVSCPGVGGVGQRLGPAWTSCWLGQCSGGVLTPLPGLTAHLPNQLGEGPSGFLDSVKGSMQMLRKFREPLPSSGRGWRQAACTDRDLSLPGCLALCAPSRMCRVTPARPVALPFLPLPRPRDHPLSCLLVSRLNAVLFSCFGFNICLLKKIE